MEEDNINNQLDAISNSTINEKKLSDKELLEAYNKSEQLTLISLLKLIYVTNKLDLSTDFKIKPKISSSNQNEILIGKIEINTINNPNTKYSFWLDIIDNDNYDLNNELVHNGLLSEGITKFSEEPNEQLKKQIINIITFLTQSAKLVFDNLKQKYIEILEYNLEMDFNTTIFLDKTISKRLGIKISTSVDL